jgi:hypothetical protein
MTELEVESECMTLVKWKLANFSTIAARDDPMKRLKSKNFQLDSSSIKCCLQFQPTTIKGEDKNYSSLHLFVQNFAGQSFIKLRYHFWIENKFGEMMAETKSKHLLKRFLMLYTYRARVRI